VVNDFEDGSMGTCYKWEINYWQNGLGTALGVSALQRGTVLAFPSMPETECLPRRHHIQVRQVNNSLFKGSSFSDSKEEAFLQRGSQNCGDGAINHAHSW
jgi:hypothetical protein